MKQMIWDKIPLPDSSVKKRLTIVFILISLFRLDAKTFSQNPGISLDFDQIEIGALFKEIERATGMNFLYNIEDVDLKKKVDVHVEDKPLSEVLSSTLSEFNLTFEIDKDQIVLYPDSQKKFRKKDSIRQVDNQNQQDPIVITGTVTDGNDVPLPGVNITIEGTSKGTSTDFDGNYEIEAEEGQKLVFSSVGFEDQIIEVGNNEVVDIRMQEGSALDEVVVVGYGSESKRDLLSSVSSVKASEFEEIPTSQLSTSLAGRLPGAQIIQNSGFVGSSASFSIRGSAIPPLFVIDNVISDESQFNILDPSEIESVSILKDASAAAIYGARAAGGVVVVKTRSGKTGRMTVNYRGIVSTSHTIKPLQDWTPKEELIFRNDVAINQNRMSSDPNPDFTPPFDNEALEFSEAIKPQNINDILWRNPVSEQHSINVSGGSEDVTYFLSGNYNNDKGSYDNTNFNKYTLRTKIDANLSEVLSIGTDISYNKRNTNRFYWPYDNDDGEGFTVADFYRSTFNLSRLYPFYSKLDGTPTTSNDPDGFPTTPPGWGFNPAEIVNSNNYRDISYTTFNANINAKIKIPWVDGLSIRALGNYRQDNFFQKDFVGEFNNSYRVQTQGGSGIDLLKYAPLKFDDNNTVVNNYGEAYTSINQGTYTDLRYQINAFIEYANSFGEHNISSFLGVEQYKFERKSMNGQAENLLSSNIDQIFSSNSSSKHRNFNGSELNQTRLSYFGRLKYDYSNRYLAEMSFREDGSYIFPKGKRFGFFPSISLGWIISNESFFEAPFISNLKIRSSYGTTGYDGMDGRDGISTHIAPFQFQNNYNINGSYVFENGLSTGIAPQGSVSNPNITWQKNESINLGFDLGLFRNSFSLSFDYFITNKTDMLVSPVAEVPGTFGTNLPATNVGEQRAHGIELDLNYQNFQGDFNYSFGFNVGYAIDKYISWPQAEDVPDFQNVIGRPTSGVVVGYISKGLVTDQETIDALPSGFTQFARPVQLGMILIEDIKGDGYKSGADGKIDENDQTIISTNATPRINFGIPMRFEWKGLSLDLFFQGVGKYDKFVSTKETIGSGGVFQQPDRLYFELWKDAYSEDHNPTGKYPRASGAWMEPDLAGTATTFWKRNGAYIRLKNLNVAYTLPAEFVNDFGLKALSINANINNLFTISSFKEYDPEQRSLDSYPIFRTYSIGLNINL